MPLATPTSQIGPTEAYSLIRSNALGARQQAQGYLSTLQSGNVASNFVYLVLDQTRNFITNMQSWQGISGLDAYATSQGYSGSMAADVGTCVTAAQAVITWVVSNFPVSGGFLQAESLNADGSRTLRQFTPAQTAGWQTAINNFIATIS
jgi:hypothetical protein